MQPLDCCKPVQRTTECKWHLCERRWCFVRPPKKKQIPMATGRATVLFRAAIAIIVHLFMFQFISDLIQLVANLMHHDCVHQSRRRVLRNGSLKTHQEKHEMQILRQNLRHFAHAAALCTCVWRIYGQADVSDSATLCVCVCVPFAACFVSDLCASEIVLTTLKMRFATNRHKSCERSYARNEQIRSIYFRFFMTCVLCGARRIRHDHRSALFAFPLGPSSTARSQSMLIDVMAINTILEIKTKWQKMHSEMHTCSRARTLRQAMTRADGMRQIQSCGWQYLFKTSSSDIISWIITYFKT